MIDLPLIAFQNGLCILPFYFLTRLQVDAGKFFFFYLTLFLSTINFSNLLRAFAYYVSSLDDCKYFSALIIAEGKTDNVPRKAFATVARRASFGSYLLAF